MTRQVCSLAKEGRLGTGRVDQRTPCLCSNGSRSAQLWVLRPRGDYLAAGELLDCSIVQVASPRFGVGQERTGSQWPRFRVQNTCMLIPGCERRAWSIWG